MRAGIPELLGVGSGPAEKGMLQLIVGFKVWGLGIRVLGCRNSQMRSPTSVRAPTNSSSAA